jgi:3-phosphoshikimate 1-carboxyvinyltransferase
MRFLTAYYAVHEGHEVILTGSQRMTERPIQVLVETLQQLEP